MPAIYAHKLIASETINKYYNEVNEIINNNLNAYQIGSLGPDPLYFYGFTKGLPKTNKADIVHRTTAKELFKKALYKDYELAYLFGFITHFTLDKNVHKYIHQVENKYSHIKLERELEYYLLKTNNINIKHYNFYEHINLDSNFLYIAKNLLNEDDKVIIDAYKDTKFIVKYAYNISKPTRFLVNVVMKLTKIYENNKDMLLSKDLDILYNEPLQEIYKLWQQSKNEIVVNINNFYDYLFKDLPLNDNFNYNFEGEYHD